MLDEIKHDWRRWGAAFTNDETPTELVRVAELVRRRMDDKTPLRLAANEVIGQLIRCRVERFFLLVPGYRATHLSDYVLWTSPNHYRQPDTSERASYEKPWVLSKDQIEDGVWAADRASTDALAQRHQWRGRAGVFPCLCECWLGVARQDLDLDQDIAGRLAILKTDAQRLFGAHGAGTATVHQLRPVKSVVPDALITDPPAGTALDGASLLRRHDELNAAKHKAPTQQLIAETGLSERKLQRLMRSHRKAAVLPTSLEAAWSGASKVHRPK